MRVYNLAKHLGIPSKELLADLRRYCGQDSVQSSSSRLEPVLVQAYLEVRA